MQAKLINHTIYCNERLAWNGSLYCIVHYEAQNIYDVLTFVRQSHLKSSSLHIGIRYSLSSKLYNSLWSSIARRANNQAALNHVLMW